MVWHVRNGEKVLSVILLHIRQEAAEKNAAVCEDLRAAEEEGLPEPVKNITLEMMGNSQTEVIKWRKRNVTICNGNKRAKPSCHVLTPEELYVLSLSGNADIQQLHFMRFAKQRLSFAQIWAEARLQYVAFTPNLALGRSLVVQQGLIELCSLLFCVDVRLLRHINGSHCVMWTAGTIKLSQTLVPEIRVAEKRLLQLDREEASLKKNGKGCVFVATLDSI